MTSPDWPQGATHGVPTSHRVTGALLSGNILGGRYRIVEVIGKGGFGAVYKARDERFTSKIASQSLILSGVKKQARKNKMLIDAVSATLILQSYLEQKQFK